MKQTVLFIHPHALPPLLLRTLERLEPYLLLPHDYLLRQEFIWAWDYERVFTELECVEGGNSLVCGDQILVDKLGEKGQLKSYVGHIQAARVFKLNFNKRFKDKQAAVGQKIASRLGLKHPFAWDQMEIKNILLMEKAREWQTVLNGTLAGFASKKQKGLWDKDVKIKIYSLLKQQQDDSQIDLTEIVESICKKFVGHCDIQRLSLEQTARRLQLQGHRIVESQQVLSWLNQHL